MSYCIYLRKSRADAEAEIRGEGETLARHENALTSLSKRQNLNITQIYREIVSGETIAARPVMQTLLTEVEGGFWEGVLVMEVERLARGDTIDQGIMAQAFKYSGTKIITPSKTYDPNNEFDEEYFEFGLFMSRREYKTINRRLQAGRFSSIKEGKYVGSGSPYGYNRVKLFNQKGYTLEENPDEANIIRLIFELYTKGELQTDGTYKRLGVPSIAHYLNNLKVSPKKGGLWVVGTVRDILINPVYIGKVRWNFRPQEKKIQDGKKTLSRPRSERVQVFEGLHTAIINNEIWTSAQGYMNQNHKRPATREIKNPLAGLIFCGLCGRQMIRRSYSKRKQADTLMCYIPECKNVSSKLSIVEKHLLSLLKDWLDGYKVECAEADTSVLGTNFETTETVLLNLQKERETLSLQLNNLHDLLEQGLYDKMTFIDRSKLLIEKIRQKQEDIDKLKEYIQQRQETIKNMKIIIPHIENILDVYENSTAALKNKLLREVVDKVIYIKTTNSRWHGSEDDFNLEVYPKTPKLITK
ncbi:serine recombinase [Clostridia bacterium]|nr:serine recombinase [Clostridia bacterium]